MCSLKKEADMNFLALFALFVIANTHLAALGKTSQDEDRVWGRPVQGIRSSIRAEKPSVSSQGPFMVSIIVENVSGTAINMEKISLFKLGPSFDVPDYTFLGFWCPVDFEYEKPAQDKALIGGGRSRLVLAKGASIRVTLDLSRHGWAATSSSTWPDRRFETVVPKGQYQLRLDMELLDKPVDLSGHEWVRSNIVEINIKAP
jgi:hypothetical protein